jgi:hypothetical protein
MQDGMEIPVSIRKKEDLLKVIDKLWKELFLWFISIW